ncbi:hypothetical protein F5X99DRAFT_426664 [Biscogniauxia marginata]|nr:hypothetical protein F5X99DRAFT_426664 [Biscogniauxia marginata]
MRQLKIILILVLSYLWALGAAEFQSSFKNVTQGSDLLLRWEPVDDAAYPLAIHAKLLNRTSEYGANSIEMDITAGINGTSFLWQSVPYPLPYLQTATYEIELRPMRLLEVEAPVPVLASSPYFMITGAEDENGDESRPLDENTIMPSVPTDKPNPNTGINNNAAIAAGLVIPVVVALAVIGFIWVHRRQKKSLEAKRKQREALVIE